MKFYRLVAVAVLSFICDQSLLTKILMKRNRIDETFTRQRQISKKQDSDFRIRLFLTQLQFDNLSCTLWRCFPEKKNNLLYKCFTTCLTHSKGEPGFRKCQLNFYEHVTSVSFGAKQKTNLHCEAGWHVVCSLPQWTQGWYVVCSLPQWSHVEAYFR